MVHSSEPNQPFRAGGAYDIVAMAASAGGLVAIREILSHLPARFPAAIVVVQHLDPNHPSLLAQILGRTTALHVKQAAEGDTLTPGTVFVAPPNRHLLVKSDGSLSLTHTEPVHFLRPSADLLFESVAASFHVRAIGVVLTGSGTDGTLGVQAIKKMGGVVVVQSEATSEFASMPQAAIETGCVDMVLPLDEIAAGLVRLTSVI